MADDLRRPVRSGEWYSKTPAQWKALDRQRQRMYTNIGRIEETSDGQVNAKSCERCTARGLVCKSYTNRAQKQGNHVSNKCSHCIAAHRACVPQQPDNQKTRKRKARDAFDLNEDGEDEGDNDVENDASGPSSAARNEEQEVLKQESESDDQSPTRLNIADDDSSSKGSSSKQSPVPVHHDSKNSTRRPQTAIEQFHNDGIHALDLKEEVVASLNDDPLHVVSSAKWANHQLAMMTRLEALEKEVHRLKRKVHRA